MLILWVLYFTILDIRKIRYTYNLDASHVQ